MGLTYLEAVEARRFSDLCAKGTVEEVESFVEDNPVTGNVDGYYIGEEDYEDDEDYKRIIEIGLEHELYPYKLPLEAAIGSNNFPVVKLLVRLGVDVDYSPYYFENGHDAFYNCEADKEAFSPTALAASVGNLEMLKFLLSITRWCERTISEACQAEQYHIIEYFFERYAKTNKKFQKYINTFDFGIYTACLYKDGVAIEIFARNIFERKLDYDEDFFSEALKTMIEIHIDFEIFSEIFKKTKNVFKEGFLTYCARKAKNYQVLDFLLDFCDPNFKGPGNYETPLLIDICNSNIKEFPTNFSIRKTQEDLDDFLENHQDFPEDLFEKILRRSDPNITDNKSMTALDYIKENKMENFLKIYEKVFGKTS